MAARRLKLDVQCVVDARNTTGESPVWSARENALYWVDIPAGRVFRWRPDTGEERIWTLPAAVGSIGLRERGGLVAAMRSGFHLFDLDSERLTFLCHPEPDLPTNRLNDGKVSPEGRFWAGTMDERPEKEPIGSLYRLDPDHRCTRMTGEVKVSNGLAWSPDGRTMYHSDSRGGAIFRYDYDPEAGAIGRREVFVSMQSEWGRPDGGATDEEGCYWGCGTDAGRINRFSPRGELIEYVELPITHPTMPCFGGADQRTLYVTSLRENYSEADIARTPQAGSVFMFEPGVAGAPVALYKG
jgi:sugar lactone lactonase YvrE